MQLRLRIAVLGVCFCWDWLEGGHPYLVLAPLGDEMLTKCAMDNESRMALWCLLGSRVFFLSYHLSRLPPQNAKMGRYFPITLQHLVWVWLDFLSFPSLMFLFSMYVCGDSILLPLSHQALWVLSILLLQSVDAVSHLAVFPSFSFSLKFFSE